MKNFIFAIYKNKKWITLGISILYLVLFCFPIIKGTNEYEVDYTLPFIIYLARFIIHSPQDIKKIINSSNKIDHDKSILINEFLMKFACSIFVLICLALAIICVIRLLKGKNFYFLPSLSFAFLAMLIAGIHCIYHTYQDLFEIKRTLTFYPTTAIFLVLLILDIVYLILEWYYLHSGQEKLSTLIAERKAATQAKQDAQLKQSPEYRIEQLEKELQELKAKNDDKDGQ